MSELALKLVNPGCFSLGPYYEFPTETGVCQSGFRLSTYPEDVFSTKFLTVPAGDDKTIILSDLCKLLDKLLQDDTDDFLPHDLRQNLLVTQKGLFPPGLRSDILDFTLPSHGLSYPHDFQDSYFLTGSFLRYVEDNQQAFRYYLETGAFPHEADMQKQRGFERQKLLVELLDLFDEQILPNQPQELKKQPDEYILKIASLSTHDKPVVLRGHEVVFRGDIRPLLFLTQAVIQSIMADDFDFFPQDIWQKLHTSAQSMDNRRKNRKTDFPHGMPLKSLCDHMNTDGKGFARKDGTISVVYTTGFKPVFDFYRENKEPLAKLKNIEHIFTGILQKGGFSTRAVVGDLQNRFGAKVRERCE